MSFMTSVVLLCVITACVCAFPGSLLVIRKQSMLVEAMSHAVLPGIVIGVLVSRRTNSVWMIFFASLMGLIVVIGAEKFRQTGLITSDSSQGILFPFLFSVGIILLSTVLSSVHVCEDTVLTGDINLMALQTEHLILNGIDYGPRTMWHLLAVLALDAIYVTVFWRVLKLATFDPTLARTMGFPVNAVNLGLMTLVSLTVVVAFSVAGAILVVALMIVPPAAAAVFAHRFSSLMIMSQVFAIASALIGFLTATVFTLSTAPMMAFVNGILFLVVLIIHNLRRHRRKFASQISDESALAIPEIAERAELTDTPERELAFVK